jgi:hypothetical protein
MTNLLESHIVTPPSQQRKSACNSIFRIKMTASQLPLNGFSGHGKMEKD